MAEKKDIEPDNKEQSQRFINIARELEVDESESKFEKVFGVINSQNDAPNKEKDRQK